MTPYEREFLKAHSQLIEKQIDFVMVTLVDIKVSAPQELGAKILITAQGIASGTVGGGKLEAKVIQYCQTLLKDPQSTPKMETWNLKAHVGMTCGGIVSLFFEPQFFKRWPIVIFGAGHVSQALVRTLVNLDCHVTCCEPRNTWRDKLPTHPNLEVIPHFDHVVEDLPAHSYILSITKGHSCDVPILKEALNRNCFPFVGVIGSSTKGKTIRRELKKQGVREESVAKLVCPLGFQFGNRTPAEIAISITAQLLAVRDGVEQVLPQRSSEASLIHSEQGEEPSDSSTILTKRNPSPRSG